MSPAASQSLEAAPPARRGFPSKGEAGVLAFLGSEVAFFGTLIATYTFYLGRGLGGPSPAEVLSLPLVLVNSACLLSSSGTILLAERALRRGAVRRAMALVAATMTLGALFLAGTGWEWATLIGTDRLTPSRNMFGTTFFTLIGFHALHVTLGIAAMGVLLGVIARGWVTRERPDPIRFVSWYWHFVDGVWVVIFTLVYLVGR